MSLQTPSLSTSGDHFTSALARCEVYLAENGAALDALMCHVRGLPGAGMSRELCTVASAPSVDLQRLRSSFETIAAELLSGIGRPCRYDHCCARSDPDAGLRWHAARLTELVQDIAQTGR